MIDKQFDDLLKRKLKHIIETSNSDWSAFEHLLDDAQLSDGNQKSDFDSAIHQKLSALTAANSSSDWTTFEHMLDEDQLSDNILDDKVSSEMNNMRAPYREDHWDLLHNSLEYQKQRNNSIIGFKVIELSLILILLLSANNLFKHLPSTFEVEKPLIYASLDDDNTSNTIEPIAENSIAKLKESLIDPTIIQGIKIDNQEIIATPTKYSSRDNIPRRTLTSNVSIFSKSIPQGISKIPTSALEHISDVQKTNQVVNNTSLKTNVIINPSKIGLLNLTRVSTEQTSTRNSIGQSKTTPYFHITKTKTQKSILLYAGLDNNLVNSPFDNVYDTEGFRTYGIGYSAGLEYGIKKGKSEFSVGLGYSNRAYEPRIIDELTGNPALTLYETSLDHIEFNIMSLSAGLKYILVETGNWSLDLGIGASANIVVNSDYSIETRTIRDGKQIDSRYGRQPFSNLDDKPLHDGIFENGSLKENIYFTTDISLGLYREISERTTFILRPEYSVHSFSNGIGPNNDLINNLSLNMGVKYVL